MSLEILEGGLFTTVQDLGRPGFGHLGVPSGGAADPWSHAVANHLAGNDAGAATLEVTAAGPTVRAKREVLVALAGADVGGTIAPGGRPVTPGQAVRLRAGDILALPGPARGGLRAYLAVAGGIDVPRLLGSRSTCLAAAFGGLEGRALRAGDLVPVRAPSAVATARAAAESAWPGDASPPRRLGPDGSVALRVTEGPGESAVPLLATAWVVGPASDRMGLRLQPGHRDALAAGPGRPAADAPSRAEIASHGVTRGTVQLPPDGHPIVLLADHQPTGGYAVPAVVISADLALLGQLAPGDRLRFEPVTLADAQAAARATRAAFDAHVRRLRSDARWEDLWRSAGG